MLDQLRRGTGTWFAKILLGILVLSFGVWGVADVFTGGGLGAIATVGDAEITAERFQRAFRNELDRVSARLGQRLTPDQARAFGLQSQVLSRLMGSAAIDTHATELGLALPDSALAASIKADPAFKGADGNFSRSQFDEILRRIDLSESGFIAQQRKDFLRRQVTDALAADLTPPEPMIKAMHRFQKETRVIKFFNLDPKVSGKVPPPEEKALRSHFEANKAQFMTPDFREVTLLAVTRKDAKARVAIGEAAIKKAYEATRESYDIAEKRRIEQISFTTNADAQKAYRRLAVAKNFAATAKALGFKQADYELGLLVKKDMLDPKIADAAFKLAKGKVSKPIEGLFRTVLLHVSEIQPGKKSTYKEVRKTVRDLLADEQATQELQSVLDNVDDGRGSGKTLAEIGGALKIKHLAIEGIDKFGNGPGGKPVIKLSEASLIVQAIFAGGIGVENDVVELADGGYAWFDILGQTPAKQKSYDEVKTDVKAIVLDLAQRKAIAKAARQAVKRILHGESITAVAKSLKLKVTTSKPIKRADSQKGLSKSGVSRAFSLAEDGAASAPGEDGKSYSIFAVTMVIAPKPPTSAESEAMSKALGQQMTGDVLATYVTALINRYGQSVNRAAFRRATGQEPQ